MGKNLLSILFLSFIFFLNTSLGFGQCNTKPSANISGDTTICAGNSTNITFTANPNSIVTYKVNSGANQEINIGSSGSAILTTSPLNSTTTYSLVSVRFSDGSCSTTSSGSATVTVNPAVVVDAGSAQTVCEGGTITLAGKISGGATTGIWSAPSGTFSNANSLTSTYTPNISSGTVTLTLTSADPSGPCPSVTGSVVITVNPATVVDAGSPQTVCAGGNITLAGRISGGATTGTWSAPSGTFSSTGSLTSTYTPSIASGTVTLTLTSADSDGTGPCTTVKDTVVITVNSATVVDAGTPQTVCAGGTITLAGSVSGGATTGIWSAPSGTFSSAGSLTSTYTPTIASGSITLTLTSADSDGTGPCSTVEDNVVITVNPATIVDAGTPQTVCAGGTITLAGSVSGGATNGTWSAPSGTFSSTGSLTSTYTPTITSGTVTLTLTSADSDGTGPCTTVEDTVVITVNPATVVDAGTPQTVCAGGTITLAGSVSGGATTGTWSALSGTFSSAGSLTSTYTPTIASGSITLTLTSADSDGTGPCTTVEDNVVITVNPATIVDAGTPQIVCAGGTITLAGSVSGGATNGTWSAPSGIFSSTGSLTSTYTPTITSGTVTLTLTSADSDGTGPCTTVEDTVVITVNPATVVDAGTPQTVCAGSSITLAGSVSGGATTGTWSALSGTFSSAGSLTSTYTPTIASGTVTLTLTSADSDGTGPCITVEDTVVITVNPATVVDAGTTQTVCAGGTIALAGSVSGGATNGTWSAPSGTFSSTGSLTSTYTPTITSGTVTLTLTSADSDGTGPCTTVEDTVVITVNPATVVDAGTPQTVCAGGTITLAGSVSGGATNGIWSAPSGTFSSTGSLTSTYTPTIASGTVTLTLTSADSDGTGPCTTVEDTVVITVIEEIKITSQPSPQDVCSANKAEFRVEATGAEISYQWFKTSNATTEGTAISGATSKIFTINRTVAGDAGFYYVRIAGASVCEPVKSDVVALDVDENVVIQNQPTNQDLCLGETLTLTISATADGGDPVYIWRKDGVELNNNSRISGVSSASLQITGLVNTDAGNYDVIIDGPDGFSCSNGFSEVATITVFDPPTANAGNDLSICSTASEIVFGTDAAAENYISLKWTITSGSGTLQNDTALNAKYIPAANETGNITLQLQANGNGSCTAATDEVVITIIPLPVIETFSYPANLCVSIEEAQSSTVTGQHAFSGGSFSYVFKGDGNGTLNLDTTTGTIIPFGSTVGPYTITYTAPADGYCGTVTKTVDISIEPLPIAEFSYENPQYCSDVVNPSPLMTTNAVKGVFSSTSGLKFVDVTTGEIDIASSSPGTYTITNTVDFEGDGCQPVKFETSITINAQPAAPVVENVAYCLNEADIPALTATADAGAILNWYNSLDAPTALGDAPQPNTAVAGTISYWVSQTSNSGCESERSEITVTVYPLPAVTAQVTQNVICLGSPAQLTATGGVSYIWYDGENVIGTDASISHIPAAAGDYKYKVVVTDGNGCKNSAEVNVQVDENTIAGILTGPGSVCTSSATGTLTLSGFTGNIVRWEKSTDGVIWATIGETTETLNFSNLITVTSYRAFVKSGVCDEIASNQVEISVDPLPVGGDLMFAGAGRIFTICENPVGNYAVDLNLTGIVGTVQGWYFREWDATGYSPLMINGEIFKGTTLTAAQIQSLNFNETTVFQVEVSSGACTPNALSKTAIITVIPSDITPSPVTVDPGVVCLGEEVTLSSETGYESGATILDQGAFDNASITNHGWRIRRNNNTTDLGFDTDANNTEFDRWKRATPRAFTTASINSPYSTSGVVFDGGIEDGNKGFALVSGKNSSTMETPIFTIGSMDQAILTFDQAYVLTPGSSLKVEISTDGGITYTTLYVRQVPADASKGITSGNTASFGTGTVETRPENKILIDLGDYMGRPNLRIRFNFTGARSGDIWAVDNIDIPEGPNGITMEWRDYTDANNPEGILIGNDNIEKWAPQQIGLNIFEIKTKLVYNSNGDACEVAENAQRVEVFVFDKYTSTVTAEYGTCGIFEAKLTATVLNGRNEPIVSYPTPDGYIGRWNVIGSAALVDSNPEDGIAAVNDPNATLSVQTTGTYSVSWILERTEVDENGNLYANPDTCPSVINPLEVIIKGCIALDFDGLNDYIDLGTSYAGNYSFEAWIRPEAGGGTIISGPNFDIKTPSVVTPNSRWYHIAISGGKVYVDGMESGAAGSGVGGSKTLIGAKWNSSTKVPEDLFSGWIEEVRIWDKNITVEQIRFLMNQRLKNNGAQIGEQIPMDVPGGLNYSDLAGYYRLISANPDPQGLVQFDAALMPLNGTTPDLAITSVPGLLMNMETNQENTAPLPYFSGNDGFWATDATWARPEVWDPPHTGPIEWNIVKTDHNIHSGDKAITVLGLKSTTAGKLLTIAAPGTTEDEYNEGRPIRVTHYLLLNGNIDLVGQSQLLQDPGSILDEASGGWLERDQQGKRNSFVYNYWSSPVSAQGAPNNAPYSVGSILLDGTTASNPQVINFQTHHGAADKPRTSPITVSTYWLWGYSPAVADVYAEWDHIQLSGTLKTGEGFTMKGTDGSAHIDAEQNYTFRGKPHNGDFNLNFATGQNYLIGNPFPSAFDGWEFINDNIDRKVFDGSLYFWDHFKEVSHILKEYVGGYGVLNLTSEIGVPAISIDERINPTKQISGKKPTRFIAVAQGFMINSTGVNGGEVRFKNSQRKFVRDGNQNTSLFLRPEVVTKTGKVKSNEFTKIRLSFSSPIGLRRQILVGAVPHTTNGFDLGYDALLFDDNVEDMYFVQDDNYLVIQGVPHFNADQILPLGVKIKENKSFTIRIDTLENAPAGMKVYLKDILNDSIHDLTSTSYISTSEPGTINDRFKIIFYKEGPPVIEVPGEEIPGEEFLNLAITHAHDLRQIRVINPEKMAITGVYLFDLNGNLIDSYGNLPNKEEFELDVASYATGIYLVKVFAEGKIMTKKIIISN